MARPTIDNVRQLGDFATTYNWMMRIAEMPNVSFSDDNYVTYQASSVISSDGKELNLRCTTTKLPEVEVDVAEANIRGFISRQPGQIKQGGSIDFTFIDTVGAPVERFFQAWRETQWKTGDGSQASKLGGQGVLEIIRTDRQGAGDMGTGNFIFSYTLVGAWCSKVTLSDLQSSSNDLFQVTATIVYDYPKMTYSGHPDVGRN